MTDPQWINKDGEGVTFQSPPEATHQDDRDEYVTLEVISELAYETHRSWEKITGDHPTLPWDDCSEEKRQEWKDSVMFILNNPSAPVRTQHDRWRAVMMSKGKGTDWTDNVKEFEYLRFSQNRKAILIRAVVHAIIG